MPTLTRGWRATYAGAGPTNAFGPRSRWRRRRRHEYAGKHRYGEGDDRKRFAAQLSAGDAVEQCVCVMRRKISTARKSGEKWGTRVRRGGGWVGGGVGGSV